MTTTTTIAAMTTTGTTTAITTISVSGKPDWLDVVTPADNISLIKAIADTGSLDRNNYRWLTLFVGDCLHIASFYRASAHWSTILIQQYIAILSVCLSVLLSVCQLRYGIVWKRLNASSYFLPHCSPIILVLWVPNIFLKFRRSHPFRGR